MFMFLLLALISCAPKRIGTRASTLHWDGTIGVSEQTPNTILSLMATGFFSAPTRDDTSTLIAAWLKAHPNAVLVPVTAIQTFNEHRPQSKFTYVWVVDGTAYLNVELVRQGCFPPGTQMLGEGQKLEVPQSDYDSVVQQVEAAGRFADVNELGVWAGDSGKNDWLAPGR
jgi:hypothetical protein